MSREWVGNMSLHVYTDRKDIPNDRGKLYKDFGAFISDFYNDIDEKVSDEYALLPKFFN